MQRAGRGGEAWPQRGGRCRVQRGVRCDQIGSAASSGRIDWGSILIKVCDLSRTEVTWEPWPRGLAKLGQRSWSRESVGQRWSYHLFKTDKNTTEREPRFLGWEEKAKQNCWASVAGFTGRKMTQHPTTARNFQKWVWRQTLKIKLQLFSDNEHYEQKWHW